MKEAPGGTAARVGKVLAAYVVVAAALWAMMPAFRRVFLLPDLFLTLMRGTLVAGVAVAVLVAWHYPGPGDDRGGGGGGA